MNYTFHDIIVNILNDLKILLLQKMKKIFKVNNSIHIIILSRGRPFKIII